MAGSKNGANCAFDGGNNGGAEVVLLSGVGGGRGRRCEGGGVVCTINPDTRVRGQECTREKPDLGTGAGGHCSAHGGKMVQDVDRMSRDHLCIKAGRGRQG